MPRIRAHSDCIERECRTRVYCCGTTLRKVTHPLNNIHACKDKVFNCRQPRGHDVMFPIAYHILRTYTCLLFNSLRCTSSWWPWPSRSIVLSLVRRSPRLLHCQLAGSKRKSSDAGRLVDHQASVSDVAIISELELTHCTVYQRPSHQTSEARSKQPLSHVLFAPLLTTRATYYFLAHTYNQNYYAFIKLSAVNGRFHWHLVCTCELVTLLFAGMCYMCYTRPSSLSIIYTNSRRRIRVLVLYDISI